MADKEEDDGLGLACLGDCPGNVALKALEPVGVLDNKLLEKERTAGGCTLPFPPAAAPGARPAPPISLDDEDDPNDKPVAPVLVLLAPVESFEASEVDLLSAALGGLFAPHPPPSSEEDEDPAVGGKAAMGIGGIATDRPMRGDNGDKAGGAFVGTRGLLPGVVGRGTTIPEVNDDDEVASSDAAPPPRPPTAAAPRLH
jgi:hypothetical protein